MISGAARPLQGILANRDGRISSQLENHPIGESAMCARVERVTVSVGKVYALCTRSRKIVELKFFKEMHRAGKEPETCASAEAVPLNMHSRAPLHQTAEQQRHSVPPLADASRPRHGCKTTLVENFAEWVAYGKWSFCFISIKILFFHYF